MKGDKIKSFLKKFVTAIIVMTMMSVYLPIVKAFADEITNTNQYKVVVGANWHNGNDSMEGVSATSYKLDYNFTLTGVTSGFKNIKLYIMTDAVENVADRIEADSNTEAQSIKNGTYSCIDFGNVASGTSISGTANVTFGSNGERLNRTVTIRLEGEYVDPKTGENTFFGGEYTDQDTGDVISTEKILNAQITPCDEKYGFDAYLNKEDAENTSNANNNSVSGIYKNGVNVGWYATQAKASYKLGLYAGIYTKELRLNITVNRKVNNTSKLSDGYTIDWGGLDTALGTPTKVTNSNGSDTYTFYKQATSSNIEDAFRISALSTNPYNIVVTYTIPNSDPENNGTLTEANSVITLNAELQATGTAVKKVYGQEAQYTETNRNSAIGYSNSLGHYSYTPGSHSWISITSSKGMLNQSGIDSFVEDRERSLTFRQSLRHIQGVENDGNECGRIQFSTPTLGYISDEGRLETIDLTAEQMYLTKISDGNDSRVVKVKYNNESEYEVNGEYTESTVKENTYNVNIYNFLRSIASASYSYTYKLDADKLGLTDTELANIEWITIKYTSNNQWLSADGYMQYSFVKNKEKPKYSIMNLENNSFDSDLSKVGIKEEQTIQLKMNYIYDVGYGTDAYIAHNENPIFYVQLPSMFKCNNLKVSITQNNYISIDEENIDTVTINGEKYLVIPCTGTYDSSKLANAAINITFNKKLKSGTKTGTYRLNAYMITDNENYIAIKKYDEVGQGISENILQLKKLDGTIPNTVAYASMPFSITEGNVIGVKTGAKCEATENETKYPNYSDDINSLLEKSYPAVVDKNETVAYYSRINNYNNVLSNIKMISRLPIANNTQISDSSVRLVEDNYELPDEYYASYGESLNGVTIGNAVPEISLTNLNNIKVYSDEDETNEVDPSNYTIYYTENANADFSTSDSEWREYVEGTSNVANAKNIKIVFADTYTVSAGNLLLVKYDMTMPEASGMVGSLTAVQYNTENSTTPTTLESPAAYVINGKTTSNIKFQKTFEGYNAGTAPEGINLQGIQFKLQYYNETTNSKEFLKDTNNEDIIATTDSTGNATFTDIPAGEYYLYEVTELNNYSKLNGAQIINVEAGETFNYGQAENPLKRDNTITIRKLWEDTNDQQGQVEFNITRVNAANETISLSKTVTTDENGVAVVEGLPYGTYTIRETSGKKGWKYETASKQVTLGDTAEKNATIEFTNVLGKADLKITKTVPTGETVEGLTFKITGIADVTYVNTEGNTVVNNTNLTITIGEDYSATEGVDVTVSTDKTSATILLSNVCLGYYKVEETNIPMIQGTSIEMYKKATANIQLEEAGVTRTINLTNNYKTGTLEIQKIAKLKEGNTYREIDDLSQFRVRIQGTSYYGHQVDMLVGLDEDGYAKTNLEIGEYTITEQAVDGYTTYYGENALASTTPAEVTITSNRVTTQSIYNEYNGIGYVRVEKTLEGITNPEVVIDAGIKFKVVGKNIAGGNVEETITIDQFDETKNVAYGVSNGISAGGEYELQEVEDTVPDYYEAIEPIAVQITTQNTQDDPVVIEAENKRGLGNLEITTQTVPEGGPLSPISYAVTEVKINSDNSYTKIGETTELTATAGYSEMKSIYAGFYLVEQTEIPQGYIKDQPQLVEVPINATGFAYFQIEKPESLNKTIVNIEKEIINSNEEIATDEDYEKAQLDKNISFEVKLKNTNTAKTYYTFISATNNGQITGIEPGTYEVEEVYKPKYLNTGYYLKDNGEYTQINAVEGKYYIEVPTLQEGEEKVEVTLKIQNKINTEFGFGGGTSTDNLSVVTFEKVNSVTKTLIVITDEDGNAVPGAEFKLYDANKREVQLPFENNIYVTTDEIKVLINGLPVGTYTLKNLSVPEGYTKAEDVKITVYKGATQVRRVEIWKNTPRGSLKLSTTYTNADGETTNVSRSKYKILDTSSNTVLKFEKTASGNYIRSKQETATDTITLKAGDVTVTGIEVGNYELGLVDLPKKYGVINEDVERITITENAVVSREVKVKERAALEKAVVRDGGNFVWALGKDGNIYYSNTSDSRYEMLNIKNLYANMANVKFVDIDTDERGTLYAIDEQGKLWLDGSCLSTSNEDPFYGKVIKKIGTSNDVIFSKDNIEIVALDKDGKLWYWGRNCNYLAMSKASSSAMVETPVCISEGTILENKQIVDLEVGYNLAYAIDSEGKIYVWGDNNYKNAGYETTLTQISEPVCLTTLEGCNLKNIPIKQVSNGEYATYFVDYEDNLWVCGSSNYGVLGLGEGAQTTQNPICINKITDNALYGEKIKYVNSSYNSVGVIDSDGKLWTWGYDNCGSLGDGNKNSVTVYVPTCITDMNNNNLDTVNLSDLSLGRNIGGAIDENGDCWVWGYYEYPPLGYRYQGYGLVPQKVNLPQTSYFDLFEFDSASINRSGSIIQDKSGKLWVSGNTNDSALNYNLGNAITSYSSSELGTNLENVSIKEYVCGTNDSMIITTNGELWNIGSLNGPYLPELAAAYSGNDGQVQNGTQMKPLCLTSTEGCYLYGKKIKCASISKRVNSAAVIDEDGKLYVAGDKKETNLGYPAEYSSTYYTNFVCLNDQISSIRNTKFVKVDMGCSYNTAVAVDEEGNVWTWGETIGRNSSGSKSYTLGIDIGTAYAYTSGSGSSTKYYMVPIKINMPTEAKIVDAKMGGSGGIALDENGEVYIWGSVMGFDGASSYTPVALKGRNTPLEGKKFTKIGYGYKFITLLDTKVQMHILGTINGTNYTYIPVFNAINNTVKDFYVGYNTLVIKDTDNNVYLCGTGSPMGVSDGMFVCLNKEYNNALLGSTIDRVIDNNSFAVKNEDGSINLEIIDTENYELLDSVNVPSISQVINKDALTVVITGDGQVYSKAVDGTTWATNSNIQFNSIITETDISVLAKDQNGKAFYISGTEIVNTDVECKDVLYKEDNLVLINDQSGNLYKLSTYGAVVFKQITGFDAGTKIVRAWGYKYQAYDVIIAQDENNGVWYCEQNQAGTGRSYTYFYGSCGIAGASATSVVTPQKVTAYSGVELKNVYIIPGFMESGRYGAKIWYLDNNNDIWGKGSSSGTLAKVLSNVKEVTWTNLKESIPYTSAADTQTFMLTNDGTVYSVGTVGNKDSSSNVYPVVGIGYSVNPITSSGFTINNYKAINVSSLGNMGKVSHLYRTSNLNAQTIYPNYIKSYIVYAYTEDQTAKYVLEVDKAPHLEDLDEGDTEILAKLNGTSQETTQETTLTGTFTDTYGNTHNFADAKQVYGEKEWVLMNDGTLYKYDSSRLLYENITARHLTTNDYSRRFELLKDSKYNN